MIGSILCVFLYCKKYKLDYLETQSSFFVIYPLIYSISKIACQINGCCGGIDLSNSVVGNIRWLEPLVNCIEWYQPLIEGIIMYILFQWLYLNFNKLSIDVLKQNGEDLSFTRGISIFFSNNFHVLAEMIHSACVDLFVIVP